MDEVDRFVSEYRDDPSSWGYIFNLVTLSSFLTTLTLTLVVSPFFLSPMVTSKYQTLGDKKRQFDTYWTSTLHAVVVVSLTLYLLATEKMGTDSRSRVYSKEPLGLYLMQLSLGYFVADLIVSLSDPKLRSDTGSLCHHLAGMTALILGLYAQGKYMYFIVICYLSEFSTPFVNLRFILYFSEKKNNAWYVSTSFGMLISFFLCRIAILPWHWYVLVSSVVLEPASRIVPLQLRVWVFVNYLVLDVLNVYWFRKMLHGGVKFLRKWRSQKRP